MNNKALDLKAKYVIDLWFAFRTAKQKMFHPNLLQHFLLKDNAVMKEAKIEVGITYE